jgi:hypothetical protein
MLLRRGSGGGWSVALYKEERLHRGRAVPRTFARTIARPPTECEARGPSVPASGVLQTGHRVSPEDTLPAPGIVRALFRTLDVTVFISSSAATTHRSLISTSASFTPASAAPLCISWSRYALPRGMHFPSRSRRATHGSVPRTPGACDDTHACNRLSFQAVARISRWPEHPHSSPARATRRRAATPRSDDPTSSSLERTSGSIVCTFTSVLCTFARIASPHTAIRCILRCAQFPSGMPPATTAFPAAEVSWSDAVQDHDFARSSAATGDLNAGAVR